MSKKTLTRPLTVLIVGCIDDITHSVGKMFENPQYTGDKKVGTNPKLEGLDLIIVVTKAVSHRLIEHWHEYGREHDILVVNGDSKSTITERLNGLVTILEPPRKPEPKLNVVPIGYDPSQSLDAGKPDPEGPKIVVPSSTSGSAVAAFMAEFQETQKAKEEAEALALKAMERADNLDVALKKLKKKIPTDESIQERIDEAVEKRVDGLVLNRTRELTSDLKKDRKALEEKIKEVGRTEKRKQKADAEKLKAQDEIDRLEQVIDELKLDRTKWSLSPKKIRLLTTMNMLTSAMLLGSDSVVAFFEKILKDAENVAEIGKLMDEIIANVTPKEADKLTSLIDEAIAEVKDVPKK